MFTITYYCPRWGATDSWESFCKRVKQAGYEGVETDLPLNPAEKQTILDTLRQYDLKLIGQYYQSFETDFEAHSANYEWSLRNLIEARPLFINCQTGKDFFTFEQNQKLMELAARLATASGIRIIHETHRGKSLFAAHITRQFLEKIPTLRLTLDISHWCTVHESFLDNQTQAVELAIRHTDHIHSRVGHPEGPQVNDPRAPEWKPALDAHLAWWDRVVEQHRTANTPLTITTEFGPPTYMPTLPYTELPVGDQSAINVYMMNLLKTRWNTK